MCGIAGIYRAGTSSPVIQPAWGNAMQQALKHRGPDQDGIWQNDQALMAHTRLSIIDLSKTGVQPMFDEQRRIVCVFNGEIYNYKDLRESLKKKGHVFYGESDSEIIPHLYEEEGENCFKSLSGMFAIAIYDIHRQKLILARDRFGIKPLYYSLSQTMWSFGSEIKALLELPFIAKQVDWQAIHDYLSFSYIPEPLTGFLGIKAVMPGCVIVIHENKEEAKQYWSFPHSINSSLKENEGEKQIRRTIDDAVSSELVSDVPLGFFLSGGIDSSTVVESASRFLSGGIKTFSVKFPDPEFDESRFAKIVAEQCGTDHHELSVEAQSADSDLVAAVLNQFDQPFGDSSAIPTYLICREIRKHVKVALSGDGGDELFGGYDIAWQAPWIYAAGKIPLLPYVFEQVLPLLKGSPEFYRKYKKISQLTAKSMPKILFGLLAYLNESQKMDLYNDCFKNTLQVKSSARWCAEECPGETQKGKDSIDHFLTKKLISISLSSHMLKKVDVMSMSLGLEVRVPLLDDQLAAAALALPCRLKIKGKTGKVILRKMLEKKLSKSIAYKSKWGFGIPLDRWASQEFIRFVEKQLLSPDTIIHKIVKHDKVRLWIDAFKGKSNLQEEISRIGIYQRIYMLLALELWLKKHNPAW